MTTFADSSALVKLYVPEADHHRLRSIRGRICTSALARVEISSAIWRKVRAKDLDPYQGSVLQRQVDADWSSRSTRFAAIAVSTPVLSRAARLVAGHDLRALDAVQLASAVLARSADPEIDTFATFDVRLAGAASIEGFRLLAISGSA